MRWRQWLVRLLPGVDWVINKVIMKLPYSLATRAARQGRGAFRRSINRVRDNGPEVHCPSGLRLGRNTVVGPGASLDARGGITLGADVNVTGGARLMTAKHEIHDPDFVARFEPIVVGDRAWIALGATVLGGVSIGEGAVVTANATVTSDVAPFTVVGGTPARAIGERSRDLRYQLDYRPNWM